jgi:hypothetical protein
MEPLDPNESNPIRLWGEIWKLRSEAKGPDGFDTWSDAAIHEKRKRIDAERDLQLLKDKVLNLTRDF